VRIINYVLIKSDLSFLLDSLGSACSPLACFCEYRNEPSDFISAGSYLTSLATVRFSTNILYNWD
jgi:hypothetical protein